MPTLTDRFMQAVTSGDLRIVMSGLDEDEALVHHELANGRTALIVAARKGHTDVLSCLIRYGSNVNHQDRALETALHCAAQRFGGREAVEILLGAGASVGMLLDTGASMVGICLPATFTALQGAAQYDGAGHNLAARRDQYEVVRLLLDAWTQQKRRRLPAARPVSGMRRLEKQRRSDTFGAGLMCSRRSGKKGPGRGPCGAIPLP